MSVADEDEVGEKRVRTLTEKGRKVKKGFFTSSVSVGKDRGLYD